MVIFLVKMTESQEGLSPFFPRETGGESGVLRDTEMVFMQKPMAKLHMQQQKPSKKRLRSCGGFSKFRTLSQV